MTYDLNKRIPGLLFVLVFLSLIVLVPSIIKNTAALILFLMFGIFVYNKVFETENYTAGSGSLTDTVQEVATSSDYSEIFGLPDEELKAAGLERESIYKCMTRVGADPALALQ